MLVLFYRQSSGVAREKRYVVCKGRELGSLETKKSGPA